MFDSRLPEVPLLLNSAARALGMLCYRKTKRGFFGRTCYDQLCIKISARYDQTVAELEDTLIHEMIHLEILLSGREDTSTHGRLFRQRMDEINSLYGRHITVSCRSQQAFLASDQVRSRRYVCVSRTADGRTALTVAASTAVFGFWDQLPRLFNLTDCRWYASVDPYFGRYRRSQRPCIYIVDNREELMSHLADARPLVRKGDSIYIAPQ